MPVEVQLLVVVALLSRDGKLGVDSPYAGVERWKELETLLPFEVFRWYIQTGSGLHWVLSGQRMR